MAEKPEKGVAGVGTGAKTRSAIREAQKKGCSLEEIGRFSKRSADTISQIKSGRIKNPPSDLASAIQKGCQAAISSRSNKDDM